MKKLFSALLLLCFSVVAQATVQTNFLSCDYTYSNSSKQWTLQGHGQFNQLLNLKKNQEVMVYGAWTTDKVVGPEYAVCVMAANVNDNGTLEMTSYKYQSLQFKPINYSSCSNVQGDDLKVLARDSITIKRGQHSEVVTEWIPGPADKMAVRIYFPTLSQQARLKELSQSICQKLRPKN